MTFEADLDRVRWRTGNTGQFSEHTIPLEVKRHFSINIRHPESAKVKVSLPAIPGYFASSQIKITHGTRR